MITYFYSFDLIFLAAYHLCYISLVLFSMKTDFISDRLLA